MAMKITRNALLVVGGVLAFAMIAITIDALTNY
jgi:hypothetical protein